MFSKSTQRTSLKEIMHYTLPKLHTGKYWYVDFFCLDPATREMKRKKYMLNNIEKITERRKMAADIIATVSNRLRSGWNPWADVSNSRQYTKFDDVINIYMRYLQKLHSNKTIKDSTFLDYRKRIRVLSEFNNNSALSIRYIYQFDLSYMSDFLDYILLDRDASARTRNNYRIWLSSFCTWLTEKQYIDYNPVEKIKSLAEEEKKRSALSHKDLRQLREYLKEENRYFLLICQMEYYTLIRPAELSNIRLKDINLKEQKVFIASSISKNRRDGMVGLNDELIKTMIDLHIFDNDTNCYLFSTDFKPGYKKCTTRSFRNYFNKVRNALNFPNSYQFYSLKDSGIRDLANSEGIVIARDQARHSDISTTNKYLKGENMTVHEETKHFNGVL